MKNVNIKLILLSTLILFTNLTRAENSIVPIFPNSSKLQWIDATNLPKGAKLAILTGNPHQNEFYSALLKLPANFIIPAHSHNTNEYNTVISGTYYLGMGNNIDKKHVIPLPSGSFVKFPARMIHYGFTHEETVIEISGIGPWGSIPKKLK